MSNNETLDEQMQSALQQDIVPNWSKMANHEHPMSAAWSSG